MYGRYERGGMMATISSETDPLSAAMFSVLGGKFHLRITEDQGVGCRYADVLDDAGNKIGYAYDYLYPGSGWGVWTRPYAGYVPNEQVEVVST